VGMHIGHVAMRVTDLERSTRFMQASIGLREGRRGEGAVYLTAGEKHHELQLIAASASGLDHVGLEVESEAEVHDARDRAVAAGGSLLAELPEEPGLGERVRVEGPDGIVYEIYATMERSAIARDAFHGSAVRRFGHLTFHIADPTASVRFWTEGLGFRISDELDGIVWARCDVNHHGFAVAPVPGPARLHHHAWEVQDVSALARYCDGLATEGLRLLWGPVRHGPGFNIATYLVEPEGACIEVYTDLMKIYDEAAYEPIDWGSDAAAALDRWGVGVPDGMMEAGAPILAAASARV
jgi:catechol 2,3-dioxygenase